MYSGMFLRQRDVHGVGIGLPIGSCKVKFNSRRRFLLCRAYSLGYGPRLTCTLSGQMCNPSGGCDFAEADRFFGMSGHRGREGVGGKIVTILWGV